MQCSFWCLGELHVSLMVLLGLILFVDHRTLTNGLLVQVTRSRRIYACIPPIQAVSAVELSTPCLLSLINALIHWPAV